MCLFGGQRLKENKHKGFNAQDILFRSYTASYTHPLLQKHHPTIKKSTFGDEKNKYCKAKSLTGAEQPNACLRGSSHDNIVV